VNVDDICRAARIAKGSFYRHYRSKEDMFFAAVESTADDLSLLFDETAGPAPLSATDAGVLMAPLLEPRLPIFLDLFARSLQRHPGYPATFRRVFGSVASHVGRHVTGDGTPEERGARAFGGAVIEVFNRTLRVPDAPAGLGSPPPLDHAL